MKEIRSIITDDLDHCYICGTMQYLEYHHVFSGTANRKMADKYNCIVRLCKGCHTEYPHAVHRDAEQALKLKQDGQRAFEEKYGHEAFMQVFGRNYL